jgi:serine phosphatase RsbU (regulator of sigma subunit)
MTFDFEKKEAIAAAEHKKELENQGAMAEEKSRKQKLVIAFVAAGLLLVLVFALYIFRSLRITHKQKNIIEEQKNIVEQQKKVVEHQKHLVEEHQKNIIDSITYAKRIQGALLPTENYIEKTLRRLKKS